MSEARIMSQAKCRLDDQVVFLATLEVVSACNGPTVDASFIIFANVAFSLRWRGSCLCHTERGKMTLGKFDRIPVHRAIPSGLLARPCAFSLSMRI